MPTPEEPRLLKVKQHTNAGEPNPAVPSVVEPIREEVQKIQDSVRRSKTEEEESRNSWTTCYTDPKNHRSDNFQYLVHAIKDPNDMGGAITASWMLQGASQEGTFQPSKDLVLGQETLSDSLHKKIRGRALSCSLINQEHPGMWSNQGIILAVFDKNQILAAGGQDLGALSYSIETIKKQFSGQAIPPPDEVLKITSGQYNEIVVSGEPPGKVMVIGVIVKIDSLGNPKDSYGKKLMDKAKKENLTVVFLKEQIYGEKQNEVVFKNEKKQYQTIPFSESTHEQREKITALKFYDSDKDEKYTLGISLSDDVIHISLSGNDPLDSFFVVGFEKEEDRNNPSKMRINYWDKRKLEKARDVLPKIKRAFQALLDEQYPNEKQINTTTLFNWLERKIDDPSSLVDCSWLMK